MCESPIRRLVVVGVALLGLLISCDGLFDGIYDAPPPTGEAFGFTAEGAIRLDCRSYTHWVYVDLHSRRIDTARVGQEPCGAWDFALHHYDVRTHGGSACETPYADPNQAAEAWLSGRSDGWEFRPDVDDSIAIDLSDMVNGNIVYSPTRLNPALCRWMHLDLTHMPPGYHTSDLTYLLRMTDGRVATLRFADYRNEAGEKGYITILYQMLN